MRPGRRLPGGQRSQAGADGRLRAVHYDSVATRRRVAPVAGIAIIAALHRAKDRCGGQKACMQSNSTHMHLRELCPGPGQWTKTICSRGAARQGVWTGSWGRQDHLG